MVWEGLWSIHVQGPWSPDVDLHLLKVSAPFGPRCEMKKPSEFFGRCDDCGGLMRFDVLLGAFNCIQERGEGLWPVWVAWPAHAPRSLGFGHDGFPPKRVICSGVLKFNAGFFG